MAAPMRYEKMSGFATTQGHDFEVNLAALLFLRGLNSDLDFQLGSNVKGAGAMDDLVFRFKRKEEPQSSWTTLFVQLKYRTSGKVARATLQNPTGYFSLPKYFRSYIEIKESMTSAGRETLFGGSFEKCMFVILTNAKAHDSLGEGRCENLSRAEKFLSTDSGSVFSFENDEDMLRCLGESGDEGAKFLSRLRVFCGQPRRDGLKAAVRDELYNVADEIIRGLYLQRLCDAFLQNARDWWNRSNDILHRDHDLLLQAVWQVKLESSSQNTLSKYRLHVEFEEEAILQMRNALVGDFNVVEASERSLRLSFTKLLQAIGSGLWLLDCVGLLANKDALLSQWGRRYFKGLVVCTDDWSSGDAEKYLEVVKDLRTTSVVSENARLVFVADSYNSQFIGQLLNVESFKDCFKYVQISPSWISNLKGIKLQGKETFFTSLLFGNSRGLDSILDASLTVEVCEGNAAGRSLGPSLVPVEDEHAIDTIELRNVVLRNGLFGEAALPEGVTVFLPTLRCVRHFLLPLDAGPKSQTPQMAESTLCAMSNQELTPDASDSSLFVGHAFKLGEYQCKCVGFDRTNAKRALLAWKARESTDFETPDFFFVCNELKVNVTKMSYFLKTKHVFELRNGELHWSSSSGSMDLVRQRLDRDRVGLLRPSTLFDFAGRVTVIRASKGNGRALVDRLASRTKAQYPSLWVVVIAAKEQAGRFDEGLHATITDFLSAAVGVRPGLEQTLFSSALEDAGNVVVIVNCLDEIASLGEITSLDEEKYIAFLAGLRETKAMKICVVTQSQEMTAAFEESLKTIATELLA